MQISRACVTNIAVLAPLSELKSRMIDVVESGDSLLTTGLGFHFGNEYACSPVSCGGLGLMGGVVYGTGVLTCGMNGMNSYSIGYGMTLYQGGITAVAAVNGAPAANETFFSPRDYAETLGTLSYAYITGAAGPTAQYGMGLAAQGSFPLPYTEPWRFQTRFAKFTAGTTCRPIARQLAAPNTIQAGFDAVTMDFTGTAGATEFQTRNMTQVAVANCAAGGMQILFSGNIFSLNGASVGTPAMMYWMRLLRNQSTGLSFSPLIDKGGKTFLDMYAALNAMPALQFANWLKDVLAAQTAAGQLEKIFLYIEGGPNDASSVAMSLDGINLQSTKAGFKFTLREFIRLWRSKMVDAVIQGAPFSLGQTENTPFMLVGPHVVADAGRNASYSNYTDAMIELAEEPEFSTFVCAWDWRPVFTTAEAIAGSWYFSGGDQIHLSVAGNRAVSGHLWATLDSIVFGTGGRLSRSRLQRTWGVRG